MPVGAERDYLVTAAAWGGLWPGKEKVSGSILDP